jgi:hypothetical protein
LGLMVSWHQKRWGLGIMSEMPACS